MRSLAWIVGFVLFVLLCWYCTKNHAPRIEADITRRAQSALEQGGPGIGSFAAGGRYGCLALACGQARLAAEGRRDELDRLQDELKGGRRE